MAEKKTEWEDPEALAKDLNDDEAPKKKELDVEDFVVIEDDDDDEDPKGVAADITEDEEEGEEDEEEEQRGKEQTKTRYQKRIDQLTRNNREAARRAEAAESQAQALAERLDALESTANKGSMESFNNTYAQVKKALTRAFEEGDTNQQVELTEKMADMRAAARMMQQQPAQQRQQAPPAAQRQPPAPPLAMEWWQRNKWFNKAESARETNMARSIDLELEAEGFDKDDPEYYDELDSRLQKVFPGLNKKEKPKSTTRKRSPSAQSTRQTASTRSRKDGRLVFTRSELEMAKSLGLTTKEELTEYHSEIRKSERESA